MHSVFHRTLMTFYVALYLCVCVYWWPSSSVGVLVHFVMYGGVYGYWLAFEHCVMAASS